MLRSAPGDPVRCFTQPQPHSETPNLPPSRTLHRKRVNCGIQGKVKNREIHQTQPRSHKTTNKSPKTLTIESRQRMLHIGTNDLLRSSQLEVTAATKKLTEIIMSHGIQCLVSEITYRDDDLQKESQRSKHNDKE